MSQLILQDDLTNRILEQARLRGYDSPEAYLLDLLEADTAVVEQDEPGQYDDELGQRFKRSFKQALRGEVMTKEELWRRLAEDE